MEEPHKMHFECFKIKKFRQTVLLLRTNFMPKTMQILANIYSCMSSAQSTPNIFKIFTDNSQQYVENNKYLFSTGYLTLSVHLI